MDPNETLRQLRELSAQECAGETEYDTACRAADMVDLFEALDGWLSAGGFLPKAWER